jgi:hypothetical protein
MKVSLLARLIAYEGYGLHTTELARHLTKRGFDVVIRPIKMIEGFGAMIPDDIKAMVQRGENDCEWEIILSPPEIAPTAGKRTVYFSMCESTRLPAAAVENLNKAEVVAVPSQWCATVFSANGVNRPIVVIPLGCSWPRENYPMDQSKFRFACAGRMMNGPNRKGIAKIIDCFQRAFPGNAEVELMVKLFPDCSLPIQHDPRIKVERRFMQERELMQWIREAHVFVNVATGGFELFPLQAMNQEKPVISIAYGGVAEFFNEHNGIVVGHHLVPARDNWAGLGHWAEADDGALIKAMRWIEQRGNSGDISWKGWNSVKRLTWERHANLVAELLTDDPPKRRAFTFMHGVGDCCNAATLYKALGDQPAIKTHAHSEFIFRAAGCEIVDKAEDVNGWHHPFYIGNAEEQPVWIDNKTAFNSPVPMTDELWKRVCETEIRLKVSAEAAGKVDELLRGVIGKIVLTHMHGTTSKHLKDVAPKLKLDFDRNAYINGATWIDIDFLKLDSVEVLYELINRADLLIGIDSGPLHMARMTDTPVLGLWFGTHPSAFAIPSPRAMHLWEVNSKRASDYGSASRYVSCGHLRNEHFNIQPVDEITGKLITEYAQQILCSKPKATPPTTTPSTVTRD